MNKEGAFAWLGRGIPKEGRDLAALMGAVCAVLLVVYCFNDDLAKFLAYLSGGGIVIWLANRRASAMEGTLTVAEKGLAIARFKDTVAMLEREESSVLVGAVYALHRMAEEKGDLRKFVFDILCEFVREAKTGRDIARQIAIEILFSHSAENIYREFQARLPRANLYGFHMSKLLLSNADLADATLGDLEAQGIDLTDAKLTGVRSSENLNLRKATLVRADMSGAELKNVHFDGSDFKDAVMNKANFTGSYFDNALNLTYEQLSTVNSLCDVRGLPEELVEKLGKERPGLFN